MDLTLVILAAGMGSRYGGLKQLDPLGPTGEYMLDYSVYDAVVSGFNRIVFVIRRDFEAEFRAVIGDRIASRVETEYVYQGIPDVPGRTKPWGTADALLACAEKVTEPFGMINADDFYGVDSYDILHRFLSNTYEETSTYGLVGFTLSKTLSNHGEVSRGVCTVGRDGYLAQVTEMLGVKKRGDAISGRPADGKDGQQVQLVENSTVSMNMWGFKPGIFDHLREAFESFMENAEDPASEEFLIPPVINDLCEDNTIHVSVLETDSSWFGVTYPGDKPAVVEKLAALTKGGLYPENLASIGL